MYFQGDRGDEVYVLQKGRVILISTALDSGEEVKSDVQKGEFFGVKSSLGRYQREETAQVLGPTQVLVFKHDEFEALVLKNTRLIMKMLRVFSKQLRDIHRQVREIMKSGAAREPSFELMNVAECFYRGGNIDHAVYAFQKYEEHYPGGKYAARAQDLLSSARKGQTFPIGYPPLEDLSHEEPSMAQGQVTQAMMPASESLDDPFALNAPAAEPVTSSSGPSISDVFYAGMDAFSKEDFDTALSKYVECLGISRFNDQEEADMFAKAHYEKARAETKLGRSEDATASLSFYLKKYPTGEYVKDSIYQMGLIAEAGGNLDRAKSLFHKVATMPPPDKTTADARKKLEKLA